MRLEGHIILSEGSDTQLTLQHRGGDPVVWKDYVVILDGEIMVADSRSSSVGDIAVFTYAEEPETAAVAGELYTVTVLDLREGDIAWEREVQAETA